MPTAALFAIPIGTAFFFGIALTLSFNNGWGLSIGETTSLFIATFAMSATIYQAWITRRHNRLQVQPLITLEYPEEAKPNIDGSYYIGCRISNVGLGPAEIRNFTFTLNDKKVTTTELIDELHEATGIGILYQQRKINCEASAAHLVNGSYIRENQAMILVSIKIWPDTAADSAIFSELSSAHEKAAKLIKRNLRIQAEYTSLYQEGTKKIDSHAFQLA